MILQVRMKPRSQISSHFSSPFFFPYQEESWNQQQYFESQLLLFQSLSAFLCLATLFPETIIYLPINILMSILMGGGD